ncbi:hypothetical protein ACJJTC_001352 [Scirpophaga incertulas]
MMIFSGLVSNTSFCSILLNSVVINGVMGSIIAFKVSLEMQSSPGLFNDFRDFRDSLISDSRKGGISSIGLEYELRLERELRLMNITFSDENILRSRGYDKTPDYKLDVPIAVDGFIVNWVESKALFGDDENHSGYLKEQLLCYYNRFGPGLVIYWFGYLETLNSTPEVNNMFILRTSFPDKSSITQYKFNI